MKSTSVMKQVVTKLIQIDPSQATPVYKQIVQSICRGIENGALEKGAVLPSVNQIAEVFSLARGSVFTAYNDLRASGLIDSIPGKGYFVTSTETKQGKRIFLLLSTFTPYKDVLYNALQRHLPAGYTLHVYFHQHNMKLFESLLREQAGHYNTFIIMPEPDARTPALLSRLDARRTFLLQAGYKEFRKEYAGVFQNFEKDLYSILIAHQHLASKYKRLVFVAADGTQKDLAAGFNKYVKKTGTNACIKSSLDAADIKKGDGFIITDDTGLVHFITEVKERKWQLGKDVGVISYKETPLKAAIGNGITTITTDYEAMGKTMAEMVLSGRREAVENPFIWIDRKSF
jgi:DNA-binding transcriptional regulator YhcF (GntR family)